MDRMRGWSEPVLRWWTMVQIGTQQPLEGQTSCHSCSPGTATLALGKPSCTSCDPGSFAPNSGALVCEDCDRGTCLRWTCSVGGGMGVVGVVRVGDEEAIVVATRRRSRSGGRDWRLWVCGTAPLTCCSQDLPLCVAGKSVVLRLCVACGVRRCRGLHHHHPALSSVAPPSYISQLY